MQSNKARGKFDPVPVIVDEIMETTNLLCFDEFQVSLRLNNKISEKTIMSIFKFKRFQIS